MKKIQSLSELRQLRSDLAPQSTLRISSEYPDRIVLAVGTATCGLAAGANQIIEELKKEIDAHHLDNVIITTTGCLGFCYAEPLVEVREYNKAPVLYGHVDLKRAQDIIRQHIIAGQLLDNAMVGKGVGAR
jgi:NADP-reducing hydrogenase subunit HndB